MTRNRTRRGRATVQTCLLASAISFVLASTAACSSPEQRLEKFVVSGFEYLEKGDQGRANVQFQRALKINEDFVPALEGVARLAEEKQDFRNLFAVTQRIVRLDPGNIDAQVRLGKLYLIGSDERSAIEVADAALALDPDHAAALALRAAVLLKLDDTAGAVEHARRALAIEPANPEAVAVIAAERALMGDQDAALEEVERAVNINPRVPVLHLVRLQLLQNLGRTEDLLQAHRDVIEIYPDIAPYRQVYAQSLLRLERIDEAKVQLEEVARLRKGEIEPILDLVRLQYRAGGRAAASQAFRQYVEANPADVELKFHYANFLRLDNDVSGAEAIYAGLAASKRKSDPVALRARNEIATLRLSQRRFDEAKAIIADILKIDDNNPDALMKRAGLKIEEGDLDGAIVDLRLALSGDPNSAQAKMLMATAFERKGDLAFARTQMAQAVADSNNAPDMANIFARFLVRTGEVERAERVLEDSIAASPGNVDSLKLLAAVRLMRQDWSGAQDAAKRIESLNSEDPVIDRILGAAHSGRGDYGSAIEALVAAHQRNPLDASPLTQLVNAYIRENRAGEAEGLLRTMIETDGANYTARILLARVLMTGGRMAEAEVALKEAMDAAPERGEAPEMLYRILRAQSRNADAGAVLDAALARTPDSDGLKMLKADLMLVTGRMEEALAIYGDVLTRRPGDLLASNNYASLLTELRNDPASRARALEVARVLDGSENPYFLDTLGWALHLNGDHAGAVERLERAAHQARGVAEIHYHLGAAYIAVGDMGKARAALEKAIAAGDERYAEKARALMAQN